MGCGSWDRRKCGLRNGGMFWCRSRRRDCYSLKNRVMKVLLLLMHWKRKMTKLHCYSQKNRVMKVLHRKRKATKLKLWPREWIKMPLLHLHLHQKRKVTKLRRPKKAVIGVIMPKLRLAPLPVMYTLNLMRHMPTNTWKMSKLSLAPRPVMSTPMNWTPNLRLHLPLLVMTTMQKWLCLLRNPMHPRKVLPRTPKTTTSL
mmetsp:Transcript_13565/g.24514  ORF Transcript_13565/g.24514 Transcript_13565/m.24514 type:complete len:200 (+) Transcript_13565:1033-1632(+)